MKYDINSTVVVPYLIAEQVTENEIEQRYLVEKAETIYAVNEGFRKQLNKAKDPRQFLFDFMEHWVKGIRKNQKNAALSEEETKNLEETIKQLIKNN